MANCYANQNPNFQPYMCIASAITKANPAAVTTTFAHNYQNGAIVRIDIPVACGMQQMNGQTGSITVTGANSFTINIDSTLFDTFSVPVLANPYIDTCAQVVPIGEISSSLASATINVL